MSFSNKYRAGCPSLVDKIDSCILEFFRLWVLSSYWWHAHALKGEIGSEFRWLSRVWLGKCLACLRLSSVFLHLLTWTFSFYYLLQSLLLFMRFALEDGYLSIFIVTPRLRRSIWSCSLSFSVPYVSRNSWLYKWGERHPGKMRICQVNCTRNI